MNGTGISENAVSKIVLVSDSEVHEDGVVPTLIRTVGTLSFAANRTNISNSATVRYHYGITCEHPDLPADAYDPQDDLEDEAWIWTGFQLLVAASDTHTCGNVASACVLTTLSRAPYITESLFERFEARARRKLQEPCNIVLRTKAIAEDANSEGHLVRGFVRMLLLLP